MEQLKDNIASMSPFKPLTEKEREVIEKALAAFRSSATVPCTSCRYCMDCPEGVEIPKNLAVYNNYQIALSNKNPMSAFLFEMEYHLLGKKEPAASCIACGQCSERCPQHIDIPHWMETINKLHEQLKTP
jgi:predicted aldo/keto reductase-like oxidoreductase